MTNMSRAEWTAKALRMREEGESVETIARAVNRTLRCVYDALQAYRASGAVPGPRPILAPLGEPRGRARRCPLRDLTEDEKADVARGAVEAAMIAAMKRKGVAL